MSAGSKLGFMRISLLVVLFFLSMARVAAACGASAGGAAGVTACSLSEHEEEVRKKWLAEMKHVNIAVMDFTCSRLAYNSSSLKLSKS